MEPLQNIKSRLLSVKNIGQITKAMEVVAATKMRKSQEQALKTRPYAFKALELLGKLSRFAPLTIKLTQEREVKNTLLVIIASDKGLAGAFNTQVFRAAEKLLDPGFLYLAVGKKTEKFLLKKGFKPVKSFHGFGDIVAFEEIIPLARFIIDGFTYGKWDNVLVVSMHFRTALKQDPVSRQILPVHFEKIEETVKELVPEHGRYAELIQDTRYKIQDTKIDYLFEPTAKEALQLLIPHLVEMQIYQLVLEANASEHSARRVAMKSASDNAEELSEAVTLQFNKARQSSITKEMVEIVSTQNAL